MQVLHDTGWSNLSSTRPHPVTDNALIIVLLEAPFKSKNSMIPSGPVGETYGGSSSMVAQRLGSEQP